MGISIVASFLDPTEAEIAAGALRAAGFQATAMDQNFAAVDSIARQALGGMRVGVPDGELAEARSFLAELVQSRPPRPAPPIQGGTGWRLSAGALALLSPPFGWLVVGMAKARSPGRAWAILLALALTALVGLTLWSLGFLLHWLPGHVWT